MTPSEALIQKIQALKPAYLKRFNEEHQQKLDEVDFEGSTFPKEKERQIHQFAMTFASPTQLDLSPKYWEYLAFGNFEKYTLCDIVNIVKNLEQRTFFQCLQMYGPESLPFYLEVQQNILSISEEINPLVEKYALEIVNKILRTQHLELTNDKGEVIGIKQELKNGGLRISKGGIK